MGTATNKSTRKYSKRHLGTTVKRRKKTQWIAKQKAEKETKFRKAVKRAVDRRRDGDEQKEKERREGREKEQFLDADSEDASFSNSEEEIQTEDEDMMEDAIADPDSMKSSSEGGSEDETVEVEEEIARYRHQLADLKKKDPEFYKYLQEADEQLLQFRTEGDRRSSVDREDEETTIPEADARRLTSDQVEEWCRSVSADKTDIQSLSSLMTAFAFASQYGNRSEDDQDISCLLQFNSPTVYSKVMIFVLKEADDIFRRYLKIKSRNDKNTISSALKKHFDVTSLLQKYLTGTCRLLNQSMEDNILAFVLRRIRSSVAFLEFLPAKISKMFVRSAVEIFSSKGPAPRLQSVLLIREMVSKSGDNTVHLCYKGVYRAFILSISKISKDTVPEIYFMGTCLIEIYSLRPDAAYQNAYKFIKDLAIQLREAIVVKDKDTWKKVCCWKFVHCLELWGRLIGALYDKGDLHHLLYPTAQLLVGTVRTLDQTKYLPMRLRLMASADRLAEATGKFIPLASLLIGTLNWSQLRKKPIVMGNEKRPNLSMCLSVDDKTLKHPLFQNEIVEQVLELMTRHLGQFSHSIGFPETSHWVAVQLKKFSKSVRSPSYKSGAMQLVAAIKDSAERVLARRISVTFSPRDVSLVDQFERDGKAQGQSPLEKLASRMEHNRQQRAQLHTSDVVTLEESVEDDIHRGKKKEKTISLSDAESLTSDEGSLKAEELKGMPDMDDILEDYVPSDDEIPRQRSSETGKATEASLPKQKRRKERRKALRQKGKKSRG